MIHWYSTVRNVLYFYTHRCSTVSAGTCTCTRVQMLYKYCTVMLQTDGGRATGKVRDPDFIDMTSLESVTHLQQLTVQMNRSDCRGDLPEQSSLTSHDRCWRPDRVYDPSMIRISSLPRSILFHVIINKIRSCHFVCYKSVTLKHSP